MSSIEAALRRDRFIILAALLLLIAAAWAYLFRLAAGMAMPSDMQGMDISMPGMACMSEGIAMPAASRNR